mmetsp:Transcript_6359/g.9240  ORF Transcript_6359/g.9240 Transcript_6359/m.9240 type:complete len:299 (-) Transcript_6359:47-943(-)
MLSSARFILGHHARRITIPSWSVKASDAKVSSQIKNNLNHFQHQIRSLFIQTENTPNPESIKFYPGRPVLADEGTKDTNSDSDSDFSESDQLTGFYVTRDEKAEIALSPLAKELFKIDGVKSVYLGGDFITVTKYAEANWSHVRTLIFGGIMDHYATGNPALTDKPEITDTTILEDDDEVVAMIKEILETRIRPAVQEDGGDIRYEGFEEDTGIVKVRLAGSCVGCPSSSVTLKNGVENMLMHYIPEVTGVVSVEEDDGEEQSADGDAIMVEETKGNNDKKQKSYEERLAAAGIPFSD